MLEVSGSHQQQQQLIESLNTNLPAFTVSSGSIWSVWTGALGAPVYLLLPCHFMYQLKHTHTHSAPNRPVSTVNITAGGHRFKPDVQMEDTEWVLIFLGRSNWLALTIARSLESPPCSLDMEIYRKEGGKLFLFHFVFFIWPLYYKDGLWGSKLLFGESPDHEHN